MGLQLKDLGLELQLQHSPDLGESPHLQLLICKWAESPSPGSLNWVRLNELRFADSPGCGYMTDSCCSDASFFF